MPHEIPESEPSKVRAGESWKWDRTLSEHPPSDGWTLKYALRGPTDHDIEASTSGDTYEIRVAPDVTGNLDAGSYKLIGFVEKGSPVNDREVIHESTVFVEPNPLDPVDESSHAEKVYEAITAVIEGNATKSEREFTVGGRQVQRYSHAELLRLRNVYANQVRLERSPGDTLPGVEARFGRVT